MINERKEKFVARVSYKIFGLLKSLLHADLSILMQTITKDERYKPNILKKAIIRHIASPASHDTVIDHPISSGIIKNVT